MKGVLCFVLLVFHVTCSVSSSCTESRAPFITEKPLVFCPYNGSVCCSSVGDLRLKRRFQNMNISDSDCSSLLKSTLCAECDPLSQEIYKVNSRNRTRTIPLLCNSTVSVNSTHSNDDTTGFCEKVWDTCQNVSITNSPFAPSLRGRVGVPSNHVSSKLTDHWQSKGDFCDAFGGSSDNGALCFNGEPVSRRTTEIPDVPKGLCLEKMGNGSYLDMVAHPDGSNRVFVANQQGQIWLVTVPEDGTRESFVLDEPNPFLDITDIVKMDNSLGLMSIAFHPNFARNGRFFASFNCDKVLWSDCSGRCSCNTDVDCDPSKISFQTGVQPCQYHTVVAEFTANGTASPSLATRANPSEVRRIFTMGLPSTADHGGQILFGPSDGYLYFMMGDGVEGGDPYNFAQNKKSLLGKIMRFDVDKLPSATEMNDQGLWGNYSIPPDNPYATDKELLPEIWALGLRNPWRCSFDSERPSYFMCGDSGQNVYEEIDLIEKGGNYGWRVYEGTSLYTPEKSPGGNTSARSITPIFPVMGYNHSSLNDVESASVTGGFFYRSKTDPCMSGRYLYTDLYAGAIWAGTENPVNSKNFISSKISFDCARDTPIKCTSLVTSSSPSLGYIFAMAEDNRKDVYFLSSKGVYRVARPSRCNYTCPKEDLTVPTQNKSPSPPSSSNSYKGLQTDILLILSCLLSIALRFTL
ncbi:hypothetical protein ACHQM5_006022 [Ranunculus cassubicifolius]